MLGLRSTLRVFPVSQAFASDGNARFSGKRYSLREKKDFTLRRRALIIRTQLHSGSRVGPRRICKVIPAGVSVSDLSGSDHPSAITGFSAFTKSAKIPAATKAPAQSQTPS